MQLKEAFAEYSGILEALKNNETLEWRTETTDNYAVCASFGRYEDGKIRREWHIEYDGEFLMRSKKKRRVIERLMNLNLK